MQSAETDVTFDDVKKAMTRIAGGIVRTPCHESHALSELCSAHIFTKSEYLQRTGSFKERGARNALLQLSASAKAKGVVAASAGNHALALAFHGNELGIPVTVVMPRGAPLVKQVRCAHYGATVLLHGDHIGDAKVKADELAASEGLTYVHGFNDPAIIAGAGTVGLEIMDQVPDLEAVIVPVGGGGLIAGVAVAIKHLNPSVQVIGVEPERCSSLLRSLEQGHPVHAFDGPTLADGLAVPQVGDRAFSIAKDLVDRVVTVSEADISLAILRLLELEKGVVEGAGAVPLAAFLAGKLSFLKGKRVVLLLCGGNIDPMMLGRVIERGVAVDGRLAQFTAVISDRPGGLADLAATIAVTGASIQQIEHERAFGDADVNRVVVRCRVEVRDSAHLRALQSALFTKGIQVLSTHSPVQ